MKNEKTLRLCTLGMFTALILLLSFTPLGYIKAGPVDITLLVIPVAVGVALLGSSGGLVLGAVFGITSLIQAVSGMSPFGAALFGYSPFYTVIVCLVPRILMGLIAGLLVDGISKSNKGGKNELAISIVSAVAAPVLNTILFVGCLLLLFWQSDYIQGFAAGKSVLPFAAAFVGINGIIEAVVSAVVSTTVSRALFTVRRRLLREQKTEK